MTTRATIALCASSLIVAASVASAAASASILERVTDVPLPGAASRFDYQNIDTTVNRLYLSHMGAGEMVVVDVKTRKLVGTVGELPRITGVWAVPALGKVYASVPGRHQVAVIDARRLRVEARVGKIGFPDGIAYAPGGRKIYVSDESGGGELVIDGATSRVVTTIPLGGEAGNTIYDPGSGDILVAVQTQNEVVAIDPRTDRVIGRHRIPGSSHPHGMAIDASRRLLFVASEASATLQMLDLGTMNVLDHQAVGDDPDVLAFDPVRRRLYVAAESGVVAVFTEKNGKLVALGRIEMPHAHSVAVDPRSGLVYIPLQSVDGHPRLRIMAPRDP